MCTSNPMTVSPFCLELLKYKPIKSVLEIGPGAFCKFGLLMREYICGWGNHKFKKEDWTFRMDCIEAYRPYVSELHHFLYDKVIIDDVLNVNFDELPSYEAIVIIDVIEHFEKDVAVELLKKLDKKCDKVMFLSTPSVESFRGKFGTDDYEQHLCFLPSHELYSIFPDKFVQIIDTSAGIKGLETYMAVISKENVKPL